MKLIQKQPKPRARSESGIALFMVIAAMAMLVPIVAEMTYSIEINSRMAYNSIDNLKAYYLAKAAMKISLVRLRAYTQVKSFVDKPDNKQIKDALPKGTLDQIWKMPLIFPLPIPKSAAMSETDAIKAFEKDSKLPGNYAANISGEGSKLNLNMLLVTTAQAPAAGASGASGAAPATGASGSTGATAAATGASGQAIDFAPAIEKAVDGLLEQKKNEDREFADVYRNVQGKDVVDAIKYYLKPDQPTSNLPGFKQFKPKLAPFYSLSELHLIPGFDDELYSLIEPSFTVYSTPGLNVNQITKRTLLSLFGPYGMTDPEADEVLRHRDDPDVGQPWTNEDDFYQTINEKSVVGRNLTTVKENFKSAGIQFITDEQTFKISVLANVGMSTRRLEAYVTIDTSASNKPAQAQGASGSLAPGVATPPPQNPQTQQDASANKAREVNLIYWRML